MQLLAVLEHLVQKHRELVEDRRRGSHVAGRLHLEVPRARGLDPSGTGKETCETRDRAKSERNYVTRLQSTTPSSTVRTPQHALTHRSHYVKRPKAPLTERRAPFRAVRLVGAPVLERVARGKVVPQQLLALQRLLHVPLPRRAPRLEKGHPGSQTQGYSSSCSLKNCASFKIGRTSLTYPSES